MLYRGIPNLYINIHLAHFIPTALGQIPPPQSLEELSVYTQATRQGDQSLLYKSSTWSSLGAGLPPVPEKITSRIEAGEFIEMAELLPDRLGTAGMRAGDDQTKSVKTKRRLVTNIVEWVECFAIYIAVLSKKQPQRVPEMLGYLILILEAHTEYAGDGWLGYDRRFRMAAAGNPSINWAAIDTTLWNLAFSGKARSAQYKHCFSLSHLSKDCEWEPELPSRTPVVANPPGVLTDRSVVTGIIVEDQDALMLTVTIDISASIVLSTLRFQIKYIRWCIAHISSREGNQNNSTEGRKS